MEQELLVGVLEVDVLALGEGRGGVGLDALVVDLAGPVQAVGEVVHVPVGVHVALQVAGQILAGLGLHGLHGGGHLGHQQAAGLVLTDDGLEESLIAHVVAHQDGVGQGLHLGEHHGEVGHVHQHHHGLAASGSLGGLEHVQMAGLAGYVGGIALVGAVLGGDLGLLGVAVVEGFLNLLAGHGVLLGSGGGIGAILDGGRQPSLALVLGHHYGGGCVGRAHAHQHQIAGGDVGGGGALNIVLGVGGAAAVVSLAGGVQNGVGDHVVILGSQLKIHGGRPGCGGAEPAAGDGRVETIGDVHGLLFAALGLLDEIIAVLHHDDGAQLGLQAVGQGGLGAVGGAHVVGGVVGVLEQAQAHTHQIVLVCAVPHHAQGVVFAQLIHQQLPGLLHALQVAIAAHGGHAPLDGQGDTLGVGVVLHAPGAVSAGQGAPVGDDEAGPAGVKQGVVLPLGPGTGDELTQGAVLGVGNGVVGHDAARGFGGAVLQAEGSIVEGDQVGLIVVVGEHGEPAGVVVVVAAALGGAGAGVVLHDGQHGVIAPAFVGGAVPGGLHAGHESLSNITIQGGVLAVGGQATVHHGRGRQVDLGAQQGVDTGGAVLLGEFLADLKGGVRIEGGGQGGLLHDAGLAVGVDGHQGGNAEVQALAQLLDQVDPDGVVHVLLGGRAQVAGDAAPAAAGDVGIAAVILAGKLGLVGGEGAPAAVGQVGGDLLAAHLVGQVAGAGLRVQPPVLIGVQRAVAVQVLEGEAAGLEQLHAGLLGVAQGRAALVGDFHPAVGSGLLFPLHVAGAQLLQVAGVGNRGGGFGPAAGVRRVRRGGAAGLARRQAQDHDQRQQRGHQLFHVLHPRDLLSILSPGRL